ncbi:MAG: VWA domain-containing protein [Cyanobacteria bacterium P01_C01_bin.89]
MSTSFNLDEAVIFAENPEPRCPCVLLLDVSGSMSGPPITALNEGLKAFQEDLNRDDLARKRVEIAIVTFDDRVQVVQDFVTADGFEAPTLETGGMTYMGAAIHTGLDLVRDRKVQYRANGVAYYRPWVFMITDGAPTDEPGTMEKASARIREEEDKKGIAFFSVGVEGADMDRLQTVAVRSPLKLKGLSFQEMFLWLSASMQQVSQSRPDEQVALPSPAGWGEV